LNRRFGSVGARRVAVAILLLGIAAVVLTPAVRTSLLRSIGRVLVVDDPIGPADVIVVAVDAGGAGTLEAADLVRRGIAPRVGIFAEPPNPASREFLRRGLPHEEAAARSARQLKSLGVNTIEQIPGSVEGTEAEGQVLREWSAQRRFQSVIVVSNADHSRRLRRVLRRSMRDHDVQVRVRAARYSTFDPDRWWETRGGVRTQIVEFQKLLLDVARHPLS
jgi:uncharacterized SAM-binding protein YcdF (DUF218 family)